MNKKINRIKENRNITVVSISLLCIFFIPGCISDINFHNQFTNNKEISTAIKVQRIYTDRVRTRSIDMLHSKRRGGYATMYNIVTTNGDEFLVLNNEDSLSDFYNTCKEYEKEYKNSGIIPDTTFNIRYIDTSRYKIITSVEPT